MGVAVNVTLVPAQIVLPGLAAMLTEGATTAVTVMAIAFDVAFAGVAHAADEVMTTVTTSPFANVEFWYWLLFVPTLLPFNFHW